MNVVHVAASFAGGIIDFLADLTHGIPEHRHTIFYGRREDTPRSFEALFPQGTEFHCWKHATREISPAADLRAFAELMQSLRKVKDCGVIHLHSSKAGFLGRIACRVLGMHHRVIYTPHAAAFLRVDVAPAARRLYMMLEKAAACAGGLVVACSASESGEFAKAGIRSMHINNGVRCEGVTAGKARSEEILIGTSGRITRQKNPVLFNQIASAFATTPSVRFVWLGDGEMRNELSSPNISVSGWLSRDGAQKRLKDIDIYLSTSLWEGMSLAVLSAMCAGKPLLLHDCVGNRDLVREGINGFLFVRAADAVTQVQQLFSDNAAREAMGKASRELATNEFSLAKTVEAYRTLYRDISS